MMGPLISIIIPTFDREAILKTALDSVLAQTYANWECIVIDDGSGDHTIELLSAYRHREDRFRFYLRDRTPKGAPTCRNIGLEHATGDYVVFLDSDDYLLPFCLERRVQAISQHQECHFLVFPMAKQKENALIKVEIPNHQDYIIPFLSAQLPWQTMCPIWKRAFLLKLNGFTEGYPRFNDPELMIRALLQPKVKYQVFNEANYDTVFLPSSKYSAIFNEKTYQSLKLFIPDVLDYLEHSGKSFLKKYLVLYLHLWFKYIYIPSGEKAIGNSFRLIWMFKQKRLLSIKNAISISLRLFLLHISRFFSKKPINKLTDKSIYL